MNDSTPTAHDDAIKVILLGDIAEAEPVWRECETMSDHYVFQTFEWLSLWYKHIGVHERTEPHVVLVAGRDGGPLALLPLAIESRNAIRRLVWLGGSESDYHGPLLAKDFTARFDVAAFPSVWKRVLKALPAVDVVLLERQPATIGSQKNPFMALDCFPDLENAYFTRLEGDWDHYFHTKRSRKTRKRIRNYEHGLAKHGELKFRVLSDAEEIRTVASALFALKSGRHRKTGVRDLINEVGRRDFFLGALLEAPYKNMVKIAVLTVYDEIAAATLFIEYGSRVYDILPVFDTERFGKYGVGIIFLTKSMKWSFDKKIRIYDFTIGDDQYKEQWCEGTILLFQYMSANSPLGWSLIFRRKLRSRLRKVAWIKAGIRAGRSLVSRLRP